MVKSQISTDAVGVSGAAKFLGLSVPRIKQLAADNRIGTMVAGRWLFTIAELKAFAKLDRPRGRKRKNTDK